VTDIPIGKHMHEHATPAGHRGVYTNSGSRLGMLVWHIRWRCWEFWPNASTSFTADCLVAMARHLEQSAPPTPAAGGGSTSPGRVPPETA
jgi:hypothetical protein